MNWRIGRWLMFGCLAMAAGGGGAWAQAAGPLGLFAEHADVGAVLHAGSVAYDAAKHSYTISGSGENVWAAADAFQFVWKKMEGDFTLTADISILGQGGDPHKKAMLMARQSLDADSAYADVALHGVGLTSLQSRDAKSADTHEIQSNISAPKKLRLQKYGDEFTMWLAGEDGKFRFAGGSMRVPLTGTFYVGLGVCAHNKDAVETAEFSDVAVEVGPTVAEQLGSLETVAVSSTDRRVTYVGSTRVGSPRFAQDGASLVFGEGGQIWRVPSAGGKPEVYAEARKDHGVSPDGTLGFSVICSGSGCYIYVVPTAEGEMRRVAGGCCPIWSPDGKTIVFMADRDGHFDIVSVPTAGGDERWLTTEGVNSGAEFSPDGQYIYFNSDRSGVMEVWRMNPDGSQPVRVVNDGSNNWFPHVSPDGRFLAFLTAPGAGLRFPASFEPAVLRVMTLADGRIRTIANLMAGPWTLSELPWSPDSQRIALVSYQGVRVGERAP
jgi:Tol biopolymer transport system component